jgi:hypothetical protein
MSKFFNSEDGIYEKPKYMADCFNIQFVLDSYCYCLQEAM